MDFSPSVRLEVVNEPGFFVLVLVPEFARVEVGGVSRVLKAGDLLLAPGSGVRLLDAKVPVVSFSRSLVGVFSDSLAEEVLRLLSGPHGVAGLADDAQEASALFGGIRREVASGRAGSLSLVRLKVLELLLLFVRCQRAGPGAGLVRIDEVKHFLDEHYPDEWSVTDLALRFALHPASLSRAFKRETGSTVVDYLNQLRVQKSCELLKRSRSSILEIAFFVGYHSLSHFNLIFRRLTGLSPREYRKNVHE